MARGNLTVLQAEVTGIDAATRQLTLDGHEPLPYDHLVVAAGATHSYFGHDDWAVHAPGLKTLADAFEIRARVIGAFERAERCTDEAQRAPWMTFVVIGAGPTGVGMAGKVTGIDADGVSYETRDGDAALTHRLPSKTVIWAAGVAGSPLGKEIAATTGVALDRAGRVVVEPDLSVPGHPEISVIGDLASAK